MMCKNDESSAPSQEIIIPKNNQATIRHATISTIMHYIDIIWICIFSWMTLFLAEELIGSYTSLVHSSIVIKKWYFEAWNLDDTFNTWWTQNYQAWSPSGVKMCPARPSPSQAGQPGPTQYTRNKCQHRQAKGGFGQSLRMKQAITLLLLKAPTHLIQQYISIDNTRGKPTTYTAFICKSWVKVSKTSNLPGDRLIVINCTCLHLYLPILKGIGGPQVHSEYSNNSSQIIDLKP